MLRAHRACAAEGWVFALWVFRLPFFRLEVYRLAVAHLWSELEAGGGCTRHTLRRSERRIRAAWLAGVRVGTRGGRLVGLNHGKLD